MKIEKTAKTVNIAIDEALKELNTTIDKIDYEVIQDASNGIFGLFSKPAKVIITVKEDKEKIEEVSNKNTSEKTIARNTEKRIPKMVSENEFKPYNNSEKKEIREIKEQRDQKPINTNADKVATKFLQDVFEKMKVEVEIIAKITEKNNLIIELKGKDIGVVIGKRGQTLDSLQYLVNLIINKREFAYMSVSIDTQDYRERRKQTLENLAVNLSKKVKKINRSVNLEPMNPYERRIIHAKLQNDRGVRTYSEGDEPFRYVVIAPRQYS